MRQSWEILHECLSGQRKAVAQDLHVSLSLVDRWTHDPIDSGGERNPLQRVVEMVEALRARGEHAHAERLVMWMNETLGYICIHLTELYDDATAECVAEFMRETGEFLESYLTGIADGHLSCEELIEIDRSLGEVLAIGSNMKSTLRREIEGRAARQLLPKLGPNYQGSLRSYLERRSEAM